MVHDYGTLSGGAERMIWETRGGLRARGHEALLFTSTARPLPLTVQADATCFGTLGAPRRVLQALNPHAVWRLHGLLRAFRPDVVHVKMFLTQLSPLILPLLRPVPSLLHLVNYDQICPLTTKTLPDGRPCTATPGMACGRSGCLSWTGVARAALQRRLTDLSVFDRVVANSRWVAERLRAEGVRVDGWLPNGVPVRAARPPLGDRPVVGFAGRLVPKKGVDVLLRAMVAVRARVPDAVLVVAGDGPERSRLEAFGRSLGIDGAVKFLGHLDRDRVEDALSTVWVQAVPSIWEEPFGLVAAEAMMRGTAVVATDSGGLCEQVVDGETGLLVPAGDVRGLADALERMLRDRALAERLGAAGRQRALGCFTEDRHVDRLVELYEEVRRAHVPERPT